MLLVNFMSVLRKISSIESTALGGKNARVTFILIILVRISTFYNCMNRYEELN
jgi:hypothetical protein